MSKLLQVGDVVYYSYQTAEIYRTTINRVTAKRAYAPSIWNKNIECVFVREYDNSKIKILGGEYEYWEVGEKICLKYEIQERKKIIENQLLEIKNLIAKKTDLHELEAMSNKLVKAMEASNE